MVGVTREIGPLHFSLSPHRGSVKVLMEPPCGGTSDSLPRKTQTMSRLSRKFPDVSRARRPSRKRVQEVVSPYPKPPRELADKWVAWSQDYRIVASHDTLAAVIDQVNREGIEGVSYERLPNLHRDHSH